MKIKNYTTIFSLLILFFSILLSFYFLMPRDIKPLHASEVEFSAERASLHIREMSKTIHPSGSEGIKLVKEYLTSQLEKLGLGFQIQPDSGKAGWYMNNKKIELNNIVSRIKGTGQGKALLILAHYDSEKYSYGAADDASGVATILESIRAYLSTGKKSMNDIIILFTDSEEQGMLGARLFANEHPWAKDVGFAINLEARGTCGPSFTLVETNGGNANMIGLYSKAGLKYPLGTSLFYSVYKHMPNDGDSRILREKLDVDGFLFAFMDGHYNYHRSTDNYENVSLKSVQHQGSYLLPLINAFANTDLSQLKTQKDVVFFNLPVLGMVKYSYDLVVPVLLISILSFIGLIIYGFHLKRLSWKAIGLGFLANFLAILISGFIGFISVKIFPVLNSSRFPENGHLITLALVLICIAIYVQLVTRFCRSQSNIASYLIAPILLWILLNIPVAIFLKGAGYLIIPVVFSLLNLLLIFRNNSQTIISNTLLTIPMILILAPMIKFLPLAIGPRLMISSTVLITLMMGLLTGVVTQYRFRNIISVSLFGIGLGVIVYFKIIS
jgi:hypothetical protein